MDFQGKQLDSIGIGNQIITYHIDNTSLLDNRFVYKMMVKKYFKFL